jgi:hypothetical protein
LHPIRARRAELPSVFPVNWYDVPFTTGTGHRPTSNSRRGRAIACGRARRASAGDEWIDTKVHATLYLYITLVSHTRSCKARF